MKRSLHLLFVFSLGLTLCRFSALTQQQEHVAWVVSAGGPHPDFPSQLSVDSENNICILGGTGGLVSFGTNWIGDSLPYGSTFVVKADAHGRWLWVSSADVKSDPPQGWFRSLAIDAGGNIYAVGSLLGILTWGDFRVTSGDGYDSYLLKLDKHGKVVWVKNFGGQGDDGAYSVAIHPDGTELIAGDLNPAAIVDQNVQDPGKPFLAKVDANGQILWVKNAYGVGTSAVSSGPNGSIIVAGSTGVESARFGSFVLESSEGGGVYVVQTDTDGNFRWAAQGQSPLALARAVRTDRLGNVYVCGGFYQRMVFAGTTLTNLGLELEGFLLKLDPAGRFLWAKQFGTGGAAMMAVWGLVVDANGFAYVTGNFGGEAQFGATRLTSRGLRDGFLLEFGPDGNFLHVMQIGGKGDDGGTSLALDKDGDVILSGVFGTPNITIGDTTLTNYLSEPQELGDPRGDLFLAKVAFPAIQTSIAQSHWQPNGTFEFLVSGLMAQSYRVEASTNLLDWITLTNLTVTNGSILLRDLQTPFHKQRFYRAVPE